MLTSKIVQIRSVAQRSCKLFLSLEMLDIVDLHHSQKGLMHSHISVYGHLPHALPSKCVSNTVGSGGPLFWLGLEMSR